MSSAATLASPIPPAAEGAVLNALCTRRRRRPTSNAERQYLESAYTQNRRPDAASRVRISEHLGWTEKAVMVWFQNRRQKDKSCDSASSATSSAPGSRASSPACTPTPTSGLRTPVPTCHRALTTTASSLIHAHSAPSPQLPPTPTTPSFGTQPTAPCSPMTLPASHFPPTPAMSTPELHFDDSDLEGDFNHLGVPGAVVLTPLISPHPRPTLPVHEPSHMTIDCSSRPSSPLLSASSAHDDMAPLPRVTLPPPQAHASDLPGCTRLPSVRTWLDRVVKYTESELHSRVPTDPARFKWVIAGSTYTGAGHPVPRPAAFGSAGFKWPSLPRLVPMMDAQYCAEPPRTPTLPPIVSAGSSLTLSSPLDALREVCAREHAVIASGRPHAARARAGAAPY